MRRAAPGNWPTGRRPRRSPVSAAWCWRGGSPPTTSATPSPSCAPTRWTSRPASRRGRGKNRRKECGRSHVRWTTPGGGMTMTLDRLDGVVAEPLFGRRDPDARGYFGAYGGRFVPETLLAPIKELTTGYLSARADSAFRDELDRLLRHYVGRPTPLYDATRLAEKSGGNARIFLKREDLTHTGAHKINNALGQSLLARRMGKSRIVAETGADQHVGVGRAVVVDAWLRRIGARRRRLAATRSVGIFWRLIRCGRRRAIGRL